MRRERWLVTLACALSALIGCAFVFIRAPHPWGWRGFDEYYDLAHALAQGGPYHTLDRIWGYPYFLAATYRLFGERFWIPLLVQVLANAAIPWIIYAEFRHRVGSRLAVLAALLVGVFSFNTVYASTQSSDALCTVLIVAACVLFARTDRTRSRTALVTSGVLFGLAMLFRPDFLLLPGFLLVCGLAAGPRRSLAAAALFTLAVSIVYMPWIVWTWSVSGRLIPATTHGAVQLWYGSLQTGPYFWSAARNPRAAFESGSFSYSPPDGLSLVIDAIPDPCAPATLDSAVLTYWTDRDRQPVARQPTHVEGQHAFFTVPAQPEGTVLYYYLDASWRDGSRTLRQMTPAVGPADPRIHFVSSDHFGDLDTRGELLDIFDIVRMLRSIAWHEPLPFVDRLDADGDGRITAGDVDRAVALLEAQRLVLGQDPGTPNLVREVRVKDAEVTLALSDESFVTVPRNFSGRLTDLTVVGHDAGHLILGRRSFAGRRLTSAALPAGTSAIQCLELREGVNRVFYRHEPEAQDRYYALAGDNIRRDPAAFIAASVRRLYRLFTIEGTGDLATTQQFSRSGLVYRVAGAVSVIYVALLVIGMVIAWRRRLDVVVPAVTIAYVAIAHAPFLTNMRYSVTVQPFEFLFIAAGLLAGFDRVVGRGRNAAPPRSDEAISHV